MQKKWMWVVLAGLFTEGAIAESNVTIYGIVDAGMSVFSHANKSGVPSQTAINSGQWKSSRLGFKGSEDLGNGWKTNFQVESSFAIDVHGSLENRNSWVGISHADYGELRLGSVSSFHDDLLGATSAAFGNATVASPLRTYIEATGHAEGSEFRNAAAYYSPSWNGLQLKLGVSTHADPKTDDVVPSGLAGATGNERVVTAAVHYANGPLVAGASYETNRYQSYSGAPSIDSGNEWNVAASYNFGPVRLGGAVGRINYAQNPTETKDDRRQWQLTASVPLGERDSISLAYARARVSYNTGADSDTAKFWGVGYLHTLSKRTSLYAAYGNISQSDSALVKSRLDGSTTTGSTNAGYQKAFQIGLRHDF